MATSTPGGIKIVDVDLTTLTVKLLNGDGQLTWDAVARALGHESFAVTADHYAKPEAVIDARTDLVVTSLRNFRKSSPTDWDAA